MPLPWGGGWAGSATRTCPEPIPNGRWQKWASYESRRARSAVLRRPFGVVGSTSTEAGVVQPRLRSSSSGRAAAKRSFACVHGDGEVDNPTLTWKVEAGGGWACLPLRPMAGQRRRRRGPAPASAGQPLPAAAESSIGSGSRSWDRQLGPRRRRNQPSWCVEPRAGPPQQRGGERLTRSSGSASARRTAAGGGRRLPGPSQGCAVRFRAQSGARRGSEAVRG